MLSVVSTPVLAYAFVLLAFISSDVLAGNEDNFPEPHVNFTQHINDVRAHLLENQLRRRTDAAAELNLPFERSASKQTPYRGKFLLIHGLNDSPFIWRDAADALSERGFDVRAILLPGHGSTPEAQLSMSYKRWIKASRRHMQLFRENGKPFYLGGFSMGGVIATLLAAESDPIDGLLLFSPAYKSILNSRLRWAGIYSKFKPWVFGGMIREDNPVKYNSIPINAGSQYYKTTQQLKRQWPRKALDIPTLAVASANDSVVDIPHLIKSFGKGFSGKKHLIIYSNEKDQPAIDAVEYRTSAYPELRVLNQSHQSVLVAPDNSLYGTDGQVLVCNGNEWAIFSRCLYYYGTHWLGAQHTPSPDDVPVARTTFNPDFNGVLDAFDEMFLR